ncbi:MAG: ATP-binding protein [Myxococcales bacterium]|nr:ATP-binding protein [Myxococcales bacterium]
MGARELFEQIRDAGWEGLETWKTDQEPESFELEFKGKGHDAPKLNEFDKTNVAKAVSGFANASGGVLMLGVDTTPVNGVDCVRELSAAKNLKAYVDAVNRFLAGCTDPRVPGAHAIGIERGGNEGVVALFVPPSDGGPHRAKGGPAVADRYFARQGCQTIVLEHGLLGAMFGRVPPPVLDLEVDQRDDPHDRVVFRFAVRNSGRGLARNVLLRVEVVAQHGDATSAARHDEPRPLPGWSRVLRQTAGATDAWFFSFGSLIYPDDDLAAVNFEFRPAPRFNVLRFRGRIDAEGMQPVKFDRTVSVRD